MECVHRRILSPGKTDELHKQSGSVHEILPGTYSFLDADEKWFLSIPENDVFSAVGNLLLILLLGLTACSKPADRTLMNYEQSLSHADSLVQCGAVDSARAVRLISGLHREYNQIKELSDGRHVRLKPVSGYERFFWGVFSVIMFSISGAMLFSLIRFKKERSHRNYLVTLSENEQRLRNNEREREELEECLKEMSLTDEEREEVHSSLTNLMEHGSRLDKENESLRARLKEYEDNPVPRELELLRKEGERVRMLDGQVQALASAMIDADEVVKQLRIQPKFLADSQWDYLQKLTDRVYKGASKRLVLRFPQLTPADSQLCMLIRLHFSNAQIATLIAVSPASVSQQKFRLKKRMMQADGRLFADGETLEGVIGSC